MAISILRISTVLRMRGRSRSAHYLDIQQRLFPKPVVIGLRAVGWPDYEVNAMNQARIAGHCEDDIRALVIQLEADRKKNSNLIGVFNDK